MQLCGKHISAAVNQDTTIAEAVFSVDLPRGSVESELRVSLELAVGRIMARNGYVKKSSCVRVV
jgi:hypothetical protein